MASWLPHIVIPTLVALAILPVARRRILAWAPLVWLPDLDYVIPSVHRALTHSIFLPLILAGVILYLWKRRDPAAEPFEFASRPGAPANLLLASYFLMSHLILDLFHGGVVLFWPILNTNFFWFFQILLFTDTNTFQPAHEAGIEEGVPQLTPVYEWVSPLDTAIFGFLAFLALVWFAIYITRRARGQLPVRPAIVERESSLQGPIQKP